MTIRRRCAGRTSQAVPCAAAPMRDSAYCFWHAPEHAADRSEAQRLGGLRRRQEVGLGGAYEFVGTAAMEGIWRLLDVAAFDTLELPNSVPRNRALVSIAQVALKAKEVGELEERLAQLEQAVHGSRTAALPSPFDQEPLSPFVGEASETDGTAS